jgi:hypothetical protein
VAGIEGTDYIFETREPIDARIAALEAKAREAQEEAEHARAVGGLDGPARAAEADVERTQSEITRLKQIAERVEQGYQCWQRFGLESAIEASGEAWRWDSLAHVLSPELAYGDEEADVRLPLDAQRAYKQALESGLFDMFEVCSMFETAGDEVVRADYYLFGAQGFEERPETLFLVAQW